MSAAPKATERRDLTLAALLFAGFLPLLLVVPTLFPALPTVRSVAALEGYRTDIAYKVAALWAAAGIAMAALLARRGGTAPAEDPARIDRAMAPGRRWLELGVVAVVTVLAFWPCFLARYGPYIEDAIFTNALHRMQGGMLPYRDFEFLYGPLMLVPAHWWMKAFGYSLGSYYAFLALAEAVQYVLLAALLQRLVLSFRTRLLVFVALVAFLANPLLGLNYNGIRRLLPLAALLYLSRDPADLRRALVAGALLGLGIAYSHDSGLVALVAAGGLYGLLLLHAPSVRLAATGLGVAAAAGTTWLTTAWLLLGPAFGGYFADTRSLVARFSAGEAGFRFYWTANALANFALLALGCVILGRVLLRSRGRATGEGDRFFAVMLIATLLLLKSGLNRSDVWHLQGAFLPLILGFLLPRGRALVTISRREHNLAAVMIAAAAVTYAVGNAPVAAYAAQGWVRGARDVLAGRPTAADACAPAATAPCIERERTAGRPDFVSLGAWLAEPAQRGRRVMLYGDLWANGPRLGVTKRDHLNDDFIYDDARGMRAGAWIADTAGAIVVMTRDWQRRLFAPPGDTVGTESPFAPSLMKRAGEWLSSVHYREVVLERRLTELRWRRTVGSFVRRDFEPGPTFGNLVVLTRRSSP